MLKLGRVIPLALLVGCAPARWTTADTALQLAATASLVADYSQTRAGLADGGVELNPVMGPSGDRVPPEAYFALCAGILAWAAALSSKAPRRAVQLGTIAVQSWVIAGNWREGYAPF